MRRIDAVSVKNIALQAGAAICGIAPVDRFDAAPGGFHPLDVFPGCMSVVVMAARFPHSPIRAGSTVPYTLTRNMMVGKMDAVSFQFCCDLEARGITSVPIPSAEPYEYWDAARTHGRGIISLKHAGQLAGLGRIGKNTLLVNNTYGNMMWLCAALVSEDLEGDPLASYETCPNECGVCLKACPVGALDGVTIDQSLCRGRSNAFTEGGGWRLTCHKCRTSCPNCLGSARGGAADA